MNGVTWAMCAIFTDLRVISCDIKYNVTRVLTCHLPCLTPYVHSLAILINDLLMELSAGHVLCFVDFTFAFHFVGRDSIWRIPAADGMSAELLRLINAYYAST